MRDGFLVFGAPFIGDEEKAEMAAVLDSGWLGTGPRTAAFEAAFADYVGARHAVAVNSCTAALHLSLVCAGIGPGDEVVTTPMTFCATVNAIIHAGATPVLADIDPQTLNIAPAAVDAACTERTRAILPVHYCGYPCDMDGLGAIARQRGLTLIEDCAHAVETRFDGRAAGTFGDFGCFSFYVTKNVVTGEGGMVVTDDEALAGRLRRLSLHGLSRDAWKRFGNEGYRHYDVTEVGFKYNMTDMQAALGLHQLQRVDAALVRRTTLWDRYDAAFADLPVDLPPRPASNNDRHALHLYTLRLRDDAPVSRDEMLEGLRARNIGAGVHYLSIPEYTVYRERFGWQTDDWPVSKQVGRRTLSLPLSPAVTDSDAADVVEAVRELLGE